MRFFKVIQWIVWKDLISEIRNRENLSSMLFFALSVILIFSFSFSMDQRSTKELMPGIIWVAFGFTGIIGLGKSFLPEVQNDCIEYLQISPVSRGAIYLGKFAGNVLFLFAAEIILFPLFILFFNLDILDKLPVFLLIFFVATVGLSALGTLFSALTVQIRAREVMFPILLLPLAVPIFIGAVESTRGALNGDPLALYSHWVKLLGIFDIVFIVVSFWVFEFILDE
ncbi:MAG: heme exporter protein CcmB [Nitrospirae bacterium]|nr:heme exporter protein CcmB [Nitrospirota bacterium]MBI3353146.1 heme exporter protein CcmB [Nitrospirota bacterium]